MTRPVADVNLIHCSYHKCLTVYYGRVMRSVFNICLPFSRGYRHFNSHLDDFYESFSTHRVASINNRALDVGRLGEFRLSRFIRDPRDLVVSGYFYHRRGAEDWVRIDSPTEQAWYFANAAIPTSLQRQGGSLAAYLQEVPIEEGLLAELELRGPHFESMARWPNTHPDILTLRYEDILGNEAGAIDELIEFYGLHGIERWLIRRFAHRYSLARRASDAHVRDPSAGQWRKRFTPRVRREFDSKYGSLLKQLGYPPD